MKVAWLTDIHLNFLTTSKRLRFYEQIRDCGASVIFITGDIGEAASTLIYLKALSEVLRPQQKVYFVAGNHDYYNGSIEDIRKEFNLLLPENIKYLPSQGVVHLTNKACLVGVDGWADGRNGDYHGSPVVLNDSRFIEELRNAHGEFPYVHTNQGRFKLLNKMQELADNDAIILNAVLEEAVDGGYEKVIILTHIPPFPESSLYKGKIADNDYLPFYTSKATSDILMAYAKTFPSIRFNVYCGHSHDKARYEPLDNLYVETGAAKYYEPVIQKVFGV